ncbi:hypothetical protein [Paracidobacterium acidisoli]|uniref:Uncharacterized protein n=1 Tax=Paracidobacterium acidisoli TaxID=2303751 RepID=A0A372IL11_9BACT|nr:hypothetical protein [Paracidobacterium acidisoli]MBT9332227.1 hypothetical protein [Paracidobacterium acidisoli]
MRKTRMPGYCQNDFHPVLTSSARGRRRSRVAAQKPNILEEIGSVAAVLHGAGLLRDAEVMQQFQVFAELLLTSAAHLSRKPGIRA